MKLYLPNGGIITLNCNSIVSNKDNRYLIETDEEKRRLVLEIVDGIVIIYNGFAHSYIPPPNKVLTEDALMNVIDLKKLNPSTITTVRNKLNKFRARTGTWMDE